MPYLYNSLGVQGGGSGGSDITPGGDLKLSINGDMEMLASSATINLSVDDNYNLLLEKD